MKFAKHGKQTSIGAYLMIFLAAAVLCLALAGSANAQSVSDEANQVINETEAAQDSQANTQTEAQAAQDEAEKPASDPAFPAEQWNEAVDTLTALLSESEQAEYAFFLQQLSDTTLYANQEVYTAIEKTVQLITAKNAIDETVLQIKENIKNSADLDDMFKEVLFANINTMLAGFSENPMDVLISGLSGITQEPALPVDTTDLDSQIQLAEQIRITLDAYPQVLSNLSAQAVDQQSQFQTLRDQLLSGNNKLLLIYLALAMAGFGIVMSIVATVFSLRKPKADPVDLSFTASRADVEALQQQNQTLHRQYTLLDNKIKQLPQNNGTADMSASILTALEARVSNMESQLSTLKGQGSNSNSDSSDTPIKPSRNVPKPAIKCYLRLNFQSLSPDLSVLIPDSNGEYALYEDGSVLPREPLQGVLKQINSLAGWTASGVLYVFTPQLDGVEYNSGNLPDSGNYYKVGKVVRPAMARANGGNYQLQTKGCIVMDSL